MCGCSLELLASNNQLWRQETRGLVLYRTRLISNTASPHSCLCRTVVGVNHHRRTEVVHLDNELRRLSFWGSLGGSHKRRRVFKPLGKFADQRHFRLCYIFVWVNLESSTSYQTRLARSHASRVTDIHLRTTLQFCHPNVYQKTPCYKKKVGNHTAVQHIFAHHISVVT